MQAGVYLDHEGTLYLVSGSAKHSETGEDLVIYHGMDNSTYVGPARMFSDEVEHDGAKVPRFQLVRPISYVGMSSKDLILECVQKVIDEREKKEEPKGRLARMFPKLFRCFGGPPGHREGP